MTTVRFLGQSREDRVRIAVPNLPAFKGIPFGRPFGGSPDPFTISAVFEALTFVDSAGQVQPLLATRWERLTPTRWRFHLRKQVSFSNGEPFSAETVRRTLEIVRRPSSALYSVGREMSVITNADTPEDHIVEFETATPLPFLPHLLSIFHVVEPDHWDALGDEAFAENPIGTGPYHASRWGNDVVRLEANTRAWRTPLMEKLEFVEVPNSTTRLQGLLSEDLHVIFSMGPDDAEIIEASGHRVHVRPAPGVITLSFNLIEDSPLKDLRVRRALNHAVDRATIVGAILGERAVVPTQFAAHTAFGYIPDYDPYPYDPNRARQLLEDAGHGDGFVFTAEVVQGMSSYSAAIYQLVAADLAKVGVRLDVRTVPVPRYSSILLQGQWNGLAVNLDYAVDPTMDALAPIERHSCAWAVPWYCDETIMPILSSAATASSMDERLRLTRQAVHRQTEQAPGLLLWEKIRFDAVAEELEGFVHHINFVPYDKLAVAP